MAKEETTVTGGEFMLFGVRVVVDSMRKSVSLNDLSQYEHRLDSSSSNDVAPPPPPPPPPSGYASADDAVANHSTTTAGTVNRERKRGVPWTEDEHKLFLLGLQKVGKGDWRGISRNFVKTRTPTQVASHAQKYFLRRNNLNRRRRRSSLFDITTDSVAVNQANDHQTIKGKNEGGSQSPPPPPQQFSPKSEISNLRFSVSQPETSIFPSPTAPIYPSTTFNSISQVIDHDQKVVRPLSTSSSSSKSLVDFDLNQNNNDWPLLSLNLSPSTSATDLANSRHSSAFQAVRGFSNGDSIISVA